MNILKFEDELEARVSEKINSVSMPRISSIKSSDPIKETSKRLEGAGNNAINLANIVMAEANKVLTAYGIVKPTESQLSQIRPVVTRIMQKNFSKSLR